MDTEKISLLIEKIVEKTNNKQVVWDRTSNDAQFALNLSNATVLVNKWFDHSIDKSQIIISILNRAGDVIDDYTFTDIVNSNYSHAEELYNIARKSYYKVDETFEVLFNELDSNKKIGKIKPAHKNEDDGNLPF